MAPTDRAGAQGFPEDPQHHPERRGRAGDEERARQGSGPYRVDAHDGTRAAKRPSGAERAGAQRAVKGFRETNEQKLKDMLPSQAKHLARSFIDGGRRHNVDAAVLAGIAKHETGNFTSSAFKNKNKNNAVGVSNARGPIAMPSHEASIDKMAKLLGSTSSGAPRGVGEAGLWQDVGAEGPLVPEVVQGEDGLRLRPPG